MQMLIIAVLKRPADNIIRQLRVPIVPVDAARGRGDWGRWVVDHQLETSGSIRALNQRVAKVRETRRYMLVHSTGPITSDPDSVQITDWFGVKPFFSPSFFFRGSLSRASLSLGNLLDFIGNSFIIIIIIIITIIIVIVRSCSDSHLSRHRVLGPGLEPRARVIGLYYLTRSIYISAGMPSKSCRCSQLLLPWLPCEYTLNRSRQ